MSSYRTKLPLLLALVGTANLYGGQVVSPTLISAKTVYVLARIGTVGHGKRRPDDKRAKSQITKALRKWGRYQVVDDTSKADLVLIVTEGDAGTYAQDIAVGGNVMVAALDELSDTLAVYKGGAADESEGPLWKATETGDDWDWPADRVIKKFRKAVEKASR